MVFIGRTGRIQMKVCGLAPVQVFSPRIMMEIIVHFFLSQVKLPPCAGEVSVACNQSLGCTKAVLTVRSHNGKYTLKSAALRCVECFEHSVADFHTAEAEYNTIGCTKRHTQQETRFAVAFQNGAAGPVIKAGQVELSGQLTA